MGESQMHCGERKKADTQQNFKKRKKRRQTQKAAYCMIPFLCYFRKGQTVRTMNNQEYIGAEGGRRG